jgi:tetratricopeptide (TPR) repeat protein
LAEQNIHECFNVANDTNNTLFLATSKLYLAQLFLSQNQRDKVIHPLNLALDFLENNNNNEILYHICLTFIDYYLNIDNQKAQNYLDRVPNEFKTDYKFSIAKAQLLFAKNKKTEALQLLLEAKQIAKSNWLDSDEKILNNVKGQLSQIHQ